MSTQPPRSQSSGSHVLIVDPSDQLSDEVSAFIAAGGHQVDVAHAYEEAINRARTSTFDAVVLSAPQTDHRCNGGFADLMRAMRNQGAATLVLGRPPVGPDAEQYQLADFAENVSGKEEIRGRLAAMLRYHRMVRGMHSELSNMHRLFERLNVQFSEVDQEMRLAGRLQSDFLPAREMEFGPVRFSALFRPASFVSGDFYDVMRVDEDHIAFYVADAVGHGMAASLLTMFIKNAVVPKIIEGNTYRLLAPGETMTLLNDKLVAQHLPNSQFVTACYGLVNTRTLEVSFARAGHPYPLIFDEDGTSAELKNPGGLLGLFESERFVTNRVHLQPGHKFVVYSDGLEVAFAEQADREDATQHYRQVFGNFAHLPASDMVYEIGSAIDKESGSLNPKDDVTVLVLEAVTSSPCTRDTAPPAYADDQTPLSG